MEKMKADFKVKKEYKSLSNKQINSMMEKTIVFPSKPDLIETEYAKMIKRIWAQEVAKK